MGEDVTGKQGLLGKDQAVGRKSGGNEQILP
jgi:hypothetical protein